MDDTISRQAAIRALCKAVHKNDDTIPCDNQTVSCLWSKTRVCDFARELYRLPPAQQWIPVTERLPEEADGTVLVCMPDEPPYNEREPFIDSKHNRQVEVATYSQYSDTWCFAMGAVSSTRPIAWMPLPEPYERSENAEIH